MAGENADRGRRVGWLLVVVGATLTVLSFVERRPISQPFPKLEPELIVRDRPVADSFTFVPAPYPYHLKPWPYERMPGGALQLRREAP
jgi:hypothetical protein